MESLDLTWLWLAHTPALLHLDFSMSRIFVRIQRAALSYQSRESSCLHNSICPLFIMSLCGDGNNKECYWFGIYGIMSVFSIHSFPRLLCAESYGYEWLGDCVVEEVESLEQFRKKVPLSCNHCLNWFDIFMTVIIMLFSPLPPDLWRATQMNFDTNLYLTVGYFLPTLPQNSQCCTQLYAEWLTDAVDAVWVGSSEKLLRVTIYDRFTRTD